MMSIYLKYAMFLFSTIMFFSAYGKSKQIDTAAYNILFIAVDDLRPELACYDDKTYIKSPNIDRLASGGVVFSRAYCQQAICGPSRASIMTGMRPETSGVIHNNLYFRQTVPDVVTLPQNLIKHGYNAAYVGKIYHGMQKDKELSWNFTPAKTDLPRPVSYGEYALPENIIIMEDNRKKLIEKYGTIPPGLLHGPAYECADVPDEKYIDGYNTQVAIETIKQMKAKGKPFFMAMGFEKPHLDFKAPKKYWDMYDPKKIKLAVNEKAPQRGASIGLHCSFELRTRHGIPKSGAIGGELSTTLMHAYYACVSYVDAQIGKLIQTLEEEGLRDDTIILLWGDHGWHLGDMGIWGKATNYEISARVPMIITVPGMKSVGRKTEALVELLDIYPSLMDIVGADIPSHVEGKSIVPLLTDAKQEWNKPVLTQFPAPALREWAARPLSDAMRETFFGPLIAVKEEEIMTQFGDEFDRDFFENHLMGYSLRTNNYRFIAWMDRRDLSKKPIMMELYNLSQNFEETLNIASSNQTLCDVLLEEVRELLKVK